MRKKRVLKKKRLKFKKDMFKFFLIIVLLCVLLGYSLSNIFAWNIDNIKTNRQIDKINMSVKIEKVRNEDNVEIIEQEEEIPEFNPYWDYLNVDLINVNISELKDINKDTVGWIQVKGTNVNYPFVQTNDNKYYLSRSFNKKYNKSGWVFMDYRNNKDGTNRNTILYAHGRDDGTMFGTLNNIINNDWFDNLDNHIIRVSTEHQNTLWQIFSVYHIPTTSDYLKVEFTDDQEFLNFVTKLKNRSNLNFETSVSGSDSIITLSTCYNKQEKLVVHAKLIKKEVK